MRVSWVLMPLMTVSFTLGELFPLAKAQELTMTGRTFNGADAKHLNLVTEVTS